MGIGSAELVVIGVILLIVLGTGVLWIIALLDIFGKESDGTDGKLLWVLIVILGGGLGALAYLLIRRPRRKS